MDKASWVGVDAGKGFHWAHALDASGNEMLSRRVENDEGSLSTLIDEALSLAQDIVWAVDQPGGGAADGSWRCCGSAARGSSMSLASPSTVPATLTAASPKRMRGMPASSPTRPV
jgi:hypothetical protein